ncbi:hypothetical protein GCM10012288_08680 [Malaciobacter pacificus]|uniref:Uncharacterized protein n=1 Tax=Malaciobacter pacificus TaxID=1080223 RepID=A0A5C2H7Z2_9BACT|nr:hypothetical protein [Malaciobacter pacificus]QEP35081.1 hypothetical protein APAC_2009 [Malaciobacter pacificus]GGD36867.1 hypothetical protein GCM10012288_08680 [Malaciobacter pacificus]
MNYNMVVIVSGIICAIISYLLSYYLIMLILEESSAFFKMGQLVLAVALMTTLYAPIKYLLIKYMNIDEFESENKND